MKILVKILIVLVLALIIMGSVLVFSASGTYSAEKFNDGYMLFKSHIVKAGFALFFMIVFAIIPYENYKKHSKLLILVTVFLLIATFLFAPKVKGAARWIDLIIFKFQPSEFAKMVLIIHLAKMIESKGSSIRNYKLGLVYPLTWIFLISALVLIQPNVSTAIIIVLTAFTLLYVGGARIGHLSATLAVIGGFAFSVMMLFAHSRERILTYVESLTSGTSINTQVMQAKIALGSGGLFGIGIGHSRQSDLFLPEAYSDFIFSVLGEEMGLLGAGLVLFIYLAIFIIGLIIAKKAADVFGQLVAFGLAFNIAISAMINAAVVIGIVPTTGITLPFISFGGTSIIIFSISIGIIINIALQAHKRQELRLALNGNQ